MAKISIMGNFDEIANTLLSGKMVQLGDILTIYISKRPEQKQVIPHTDKVVVIPASIDPKVLGGNSEKMRLAAEKSGVEVISFSTDKAINQIQEILKTDTTISFVADKQIAVIENTQVGTMNRTKLTLDSMLLEIIQQRKDDLVNGIIEVRARDLDPEKYRDDREGWEIVEFKKS